MCLKQPTRQTNDDDPTGRELVPTRQLLLLTLKHRSRDTWHFRGSSDSNALQFKQERDDIHFRSFQPPEGKGGGEPAGNGME